MPALVHVGTVSVNVSRVLVMVGYTVTVKVLPVDVPVPVTVTVDSCVNVIVDVGTMLCDVTVWHSSASCCGNA